MNADIILLRGILLGISFKTQALIFLVFATRYLDLFYIFSHSIHSYYNLVLKLAYLGSTGYICYLMWVQFRSSWNPDLDTLRIEYILVPCGVFALLLTHKYTILEVCPLFPNFFLVRFCIGCNWDDALTIAMN